MQMAKKILLALIFTVSFTFAINYFIWSILNTVKPGWFDGDDVDSIWIFWLLFGLFLLSAISSCLWLINFQSGFWLWKTPTLLVFPFSIPYLILDYCEFRKLKKGILDYQPVNKKEYFILLIIIMVLNGVIVFLQLGFLPLLLVLSFQNLYFFFIPLTMILGSIFLTLDYFYAKKFYRWLAILGIVTNWFLLFFQTIDQKNSVNFFFERKN